MNKNATLEIITGIKPHPNADRLELVIVGGFQNIVPKDFYRDGDKVWYIHPDTVLPKNECWSQKYLKYAENRVKAINIRGEWSEGIVIPYGEIHLEDIEIGGEISHLIGVEHYIIPEPENEEALTSELPHNIRETGQERYESLPEIPYGKICDVSLKIDGKSTSFYYKIIQDYFGILGRKQEMRKDFQNDYTIQVDKFDIQNKLKQYCIKNNIDLCLRGEAFGVGISSSGINPHSKIEKSWSMYDVWLIEERRYTRKGEPFYFLNVADEMGLPVVDIIERDVVITPELIHKYSKELKEINGKPFEGVVLKFDTGSFKVMNAYYDSKK